MNSDVLQEERKERGGTRACRIGASPTGRHDHARSLHLFNFNVASKRRKEKERKKNTAAPPQSHRVFRTICTLLSWVGTPSPDLFTLLLSAQATISTSISLSLSLASRRTRTLTLIQRSSPRNIYKSTFNRVHTRASFIYIDPPILLHLIVILKHPTRLIHGIRRFLLTIFLDPQLRPL